MRVVQLILLIILSYHTILASHTRTIEYKGQIDKDTFWKSTIDPYHKWMMNSGLYSKIDYLNLYNLAIDYYYIGYGLNYTGNDIDPSTGGVRLPTTIMYPYGFMYELTYDSDHPDRNNGTYIYSIYEFGFMVVATDSGTFGGLMNGTGYNKYDMLFVTEYKIVGGFLHSLVETIKSQSRVTSNSHIILTYVGEPNGGSGANKVNIEPDGSLYGYMILINYVDIWC